MKGFKDLNECGKVRHGEQLKLKPTKNGKFSLIGINTCKKPVCPNCLKVLLKKQEKSILQAVEYAKENNLVVSLGLSICRKVKIKALCSKESSCIKSYQIF